MIEGASRTSAPAMHIPGLNRYLASAWTRWQIRGARPAAQSLVVRDGWVLRPCWRARLAAWICFLLFGGGLAGVFALQLMRPLPQQQFILLTGCYILLALLATGYLIFIYWYRVTVDRDELVLVRFLSPTRRIRWEEVVEFQFAPGDELLKLHSKTGQTVAVYTSLHGLSAIRRCLWNLPPKSATLINSWITSDPVLNDCVPAWRCADAILADDPFQHWLPEMAVKTDHH